VNVPPSEPTEWQVIIGDYKDEQELEGKKLAAQNAGYTNGEPFGTPPHLHLRFRFASREGAKEAADRLKAAKVSHEPDVLRYRPKP
jgi:hypothetical protein